MNRFHHIAIVLLALSFAACLVTAPEVDEPLPAAPGIDPQTGDGGEGCSTGAHCYVNGEDGQCMWNGTCCTECIDHDARPPACVPHLFEPYTGECGPCGQCPSPLACHGPSNRCRLPCDGITPCPDSGDACWSYECTVGLCLIAYSPPGTTCPGGTCSTAGVCR
jgi:hypothetical protein